ncbi:MAG: hypothetical protein EZS28_018088 [Streblomastix strix]|uniref:Uncharacterized protein n=1 Tax=Streblomastix strix TaxID=222440 RepID=A0A5J4VW34_9EUKA|nr:MAG: hypothetical protein EZS28_018088 [Streblomastix strix]
MYNEEILSIEELQNHKRKLSSNEIKSELKFRNQKKALRIKQENNEQEDAENEGEVINQKFAPLLLFASGNSGHNCELNSVIWQRTLSQHGTGGVSMIESVGYEITILDSILQGTDFTVNDTSNKTDTQNGSTKAQTKKMKNLRNFSNSQMQPLKNADNTTAQNQTQTLSQIY